VTLSPGRPGTVERLLHGGLAWRTGRL